MEWRIVVPVLCLIAFTGAGVNATSNNATNITTSEPPSAPATATNQTANNNQTTTTAATTVSTPAKLATVNVVFRILQEFKEIYSNLSDPETIKLTENITNGFTPIYKKHFPNFLRMRIQKFSRGSVVADSVFEFDNTNNTSPNVTEVTNTFTEAVKTGNLSFPVDDKSINATNITASEPPSAPATATNQTANNNQTTTTAATTVSTPAKLATVNVVFRILQEFKEIYSNLSDPETIKLTENITNGFTPIYKKRFPNFLRMRIRKFSRGSVVADSVFEFDNTNNTSPNVTEVTNTFTEAVKTGNFSFPVDDKSINATNITASEPPSAPATATNQTANNNQTTTTAATTVSTPAKLATVNVVFRILQEFKEIYSNLSDPETIKLTENITNGFTPIYKKRFPNFLRMRIRKFSRGSIVADSVFEFDNTNNTSPNVTEVTNTFTEAVKTGNLSFPVDDKSINVTDITTSETNVTATANTSTTTQAATTSVSVEGFNLTFKMTGDFTDDLSNMSSSAAINLANTVIGQLDKVFKKIASHRRTFVRQFRRGSIDVDAGLEFNKVSSPTAADLAKALADGVRNGVVALPIDPKTIKVTDSTGATASKSPVLASMLTAFWMTLASLLLSAVMH